MKEKKVMSKVKSHLKEDNRDCKKESKEHNKMVKDINKSKMMKKKK